MSARPDPRPIGAFRRRSGGDAPASRPGKVSIAPSRCWLLIFLGLWLPAAALTAAEGPERGLSAAFNYPGLVVGIEDRLEMPLTIRNPGRADDSFRVTVLEKPQGWEVSLRAPAAVVTGAFLPGGEETVLTLSAGPEDGRPPAPGDYLFKVRVESLDAILSRETECLVTVRGARTGLAALTLSSAHPALRGPGDGRFSFALELRNRGGDDGPAGLSVEAPEGWEAYFQPGYEDKRISSIQIPRGQSRALALEVRPGYRAEAGLYPLKVRAESKWGAAETTLTVELTGTYRLRLFPAGEMLSATAEAGRPVSLSFFVLNEGSAPQRGVRLLTVAPDNWKVELDPPVIPLLEPYRAPTPVTLTVTPAAGALAGDYALGLAAEGERSQSPLDLRLTVRPPAVWAWLGAAIIALTVGGLFYAFRRLGRR